MIYLIQDIFPPGKYAKTISRNAQYIVVFENPREQTGIHYLVRQIFSNHWPSALDVYRKATDCPFRYLLFDLHPGSSDTYRMYTNILKGEGYPITYRRKVEEPPDVRRKGIKRKR